MNERIRQLEIQAIAYADSKVPASDRYNDIYHSIVRGKFAELIMEKVVELIDEKIEDLDGYAKAGDDEFVARVVGAHQAKEVIEDYFGVE